MVSVMRGALGKLSVYPSSKEQETSMFFFSFFLLLFSFSSFSLGSVKLLLEDERVSVDARRGEALVSSSARGHKKVIL